MSSGAFTLTEYQASYDSSGLTLHPIKVQPETLTADIGGTTNAAPTTGTPNPISAKVSANKRALGLIPRTITLKSPATGQPTGYKPNSITVIPALTTAFYDVAVKGATCSYLNVNFTVIGRSPERAN